MAPSVSTTTPVIDREETTVCSESVLRSRDYLVLLQHHCSFVKKKTLLCTSFGMLSVYQAFSWLAP